MPSLGPTELIIILIIVLLLFGGSRLAGLGKSTGRALKEFKEETKGLKKSEEPSPSTSEPAPQIQQSPPPSENQVSDPAPSETRRDL